jgi:aconitate hydratase
MKNRLATPKEGGFTVKFPEDDLMSVYDAAMKYKAEGIPLVVLAGKEYGTGSSRDWAAKGPHLLGVKAVFAESFERIHRSNLVGMGILPLVYKAGESWESLGLDGTESFSIGGLDTIRPGKLLQISAAKRDGAEVHFEAVARLDTEVEVEYYKNSGILSYVLRRIQGASQE